jgi:nitrogen regulatory protein P-II 1
MKKIEAIVRAERMSDVKERLGQLGVSGMTVETVSGWSKQRELQKTERRMAFEMSLLQPLLIMNLKKTKPN